MNTLKEIFKHLVILWGLVLLTIIVKEVMSAEVLTNASTGLWVFMGSVVPIISGMIQSKYKQKKNVNDTNKSNQ